MRLIYTDFLAQVAQNDVKVLEVKDKEYGGSWKRRGGVGAFMMLARKWDRLESALDPNKGPSSNQHLAPLSSRLGNGKFVPAYDIFSAIAADPRAEGILDDVRDLRRYLMLVEAEMLARGHSVERAEAERDIVRSGRTEQERPFGFDAAQDAAPTTKAS